MEAFATIVKINHLVYFLRGQMGKAEQTHQRIIVQAAPLFNQYGYAGTSIYEVMRVTGLKKGGLYSHFESKEALALAVFDYAFALMNERFTTFLAEAPATCTGQLLASIDAFATMVQSPPVAGGCAILNTAIESDDTFPPLKDRARQAMEEWFGLIKRLVKSGIHKHEFRPNIDGEGVATIIIASLEGALMLSKLSNDPIHMDRAVKHLRAYIASEVAC